MDKPLSIKKEEFEQGLVQLINNCELPIYIIEPIVRAYSIELKGLNEAQTNRERQQYLASMKEEVSADEDETKGQCD